MKNTCLIFILFALSLCLSADSNPPYLRSFGIMNDRYELASFSTRYMIVSQSAGDSLSELDSDSMVGPGENPYYIDEDKTYYLELRDSTNKVIWSREILKMHARSDSVDAIHEVRDDNIEPSLVRGISLATDGTTLLADKENMNYYLLDKNGKRTNLPFKTLGMTSGGLIGNRYWLLAHGVGIHHVPMSEYAPQPEDESLEPFYTSYVTLYNKDGSMYKFIDLSDWGQINDFQIDPTASYCWFSWYMKTSFDSETGERIAIPNDPDQDQVPGMTIMLLDGKIIYSGMIPEFKNGDYMTNFGWSANSDLIHFWYGNSFKIFDTSTGTLYAKLETINCGPYYGNSIVALSCKTAGLVFLNSYSYLVVYDYINQNTVAVIPDWGYSSDVHLEKADGSEFTIWTGGKKTTYRLNQ